MISLKRYLSSNTTETEETLRQLIALFVRKIGESAVVVDQHELEAFRDEIRRVQEALTSDLPMENMLIVTGSATQALETYNKRVMRTIGNQGNDVQAILKLLQDHLGKMTGANNHSIESLGKVGEELERFKGFKDLQPLKLHLTQCLSGLRTEIEREKSASKELIERLQIDIEGFRESDRARSHPDRAQLKPDREQPASDPATGLQRQGECIAAIQAAIDKGTRHYAVVMVVSRVQPINARFGRAAGDLMLLRFKEMMEIRIVAPDRLFRWSGPAMVAILERPQPLTIIRLVVKRLVDVRTEETFQFGDRAVLVPISATWCVFPLEATPAATEKQIHAFIASQGNRDFA